MTIEEAIKLVSTATWKYVEDKSDAEKQQMIEAMGTLLGHAKIGAYMQEEMKKITGNNSQQ